MPSYRIKYTRNDLDELSGTALIVTEKLSAETPEGALEILKAGGYPQFSHATIISIERLET